MQALTTSSLKLSLNFFDFYRYEGLKYLSFQKTVESTKIQPKAHTTNRCDHDSLDRCGTNSLLG
jgi:hypothetical protein